MMLTARLRKLILTTHITASVGWIGAVVAYLALVFAAMSTEELETLRATWIAMDLVGWYAIVPLSLASLFTGLVISLGTKWGLIRHYWVLISFGLTTLATLVLLEHMGAVSFFAGLATEADSTVGELQGGLASELFHAGLGLLILLVVQVLNIYKPRGLTPYGWRKQQEERTGVPATDAAT